MIEKERGSFEVAIRIPLRSPSFLFNDLVFLRIPRKSLKPRQLLFSIPTTLPIQRRRRGQIPSIIGV